MSSFKVRVAIESDYMLLADFNIWMAKETEDKDLNPDVVREGVRNCIINPAYGRYCCAENEEGRVVGGLLITFEMSPRLGGMIYWIQSAYVLPEYRGKGVFRALYDFVVASSNSDPVAKCVRLYVDAENTKAQAVYSKLGMMKLEGIAFEEHDFHFSH